jgi:hypothetical protein
MYKWTNISNGRRPRWFVIRGDVLAYSKEDPVVRSGGAAPRIRDRRRWRATGFGVACGAGGVEERPIGFVHLPDSSIFAPSSHYSL